MMARQFALPYRWSTLHHVLWPDRGDRARFTTPRVREYNEAIALLEERDRALEDYLNRSSGGARPYATRVVAAADSIATDAASADYICTGTGTDDVTIQAALDALDLVGGTVVLLEGSYYCASGPDAFTPSIQIGTNQILRGQGSINTFLYFDSGSTMGLSNAGELRDVTVTLGSEGEA